jgi:hypothetical protein
MDPITIWLFCLATAWFLRAAVEDGIAGVRGQESPRIARARARQQITRDRMAMTGGRTIGRAVAGRVADRIANPPKEIGPFRQYLGGLWGDAWEDAATRHEARRQRRAERAEREREEQTEREAAGRPDPDGASRTRKCRGCRRVLVVEPNELCTLCEAAERVSDYPTAPVHWCVGGCGRPVPDPGGDPSGGWCRDCRFYYGPQCGAGCGKKVSTSGQLCETCERSTASVHWCNCGRHQVESPGQVCPSCEERGGLPVSETPEPGPAPDLTTQEGKPMPNHLPERQPYEPPERRYVAWFKDAHGNPWDYRRLFYARGWDAANKIAEDLCRRTAKYAHVMEIAVADPDPNPPGRVLIPPDDALDGLPPKTSEPTPAPGTTREDTPPVTTSIDGDVTSPLTALGFADGCIDFNRADMGEADAMANNLTGEGVGPEFVGIVRDAWAAGDQFDAAASGARDEYARHVATQAEIAGNTDLRDTVQGTYLDTSNA